MCAWSGWRKVLDGVLEAIGLGGDENAGRRLTVLRAIDKLDKFGPEGVKLLLGAGRTPLHLALIPLLWTLIAGATAWILGIPQDLALPVVGIGAIVLILWKNRRYEHA